MYEINCNMMIIRYLGCCIEGAFIYSLQLGVYARKYYQRLPTHLSLKKCCNTHIDKLNIKDPL